VIATVYDWALQIKTKTLHVFTSRKLLVSIYFKESENAEKIEYELAQSMEGL